MATSYKILGQKVIATTNTGLVLYVATPASLTCQTIVSTITVCNTNSTTSTYSIAVKQLDAATNPVDLLPSLTNESYVVYSASIAPNETVSYTLGLTLDKFDKIVVNGTAGVSFNAYGSETQA